MEAKPAESPLADLCEDGWHTTMCGRCGCCACQCCPTCHRCIGSDCGNGCKGHASPRFVVDEFGPRAFAVRDTVSQLSYGPCFTRKAAQDAADRRNAKHPSASR